MPPIEVAYVAVNTIDDEGYRIMRPHEEVESDIEALRAKAKAVGGKVLGIAAVERRVNARVSGGVQAYDIPHQMVVVDIPHFTELTPRDQ